VGLCEEKGNIRGVHFNNRKWIFLLNFFKETPKSLPRHLILGEINESLPITDYSVNDRLMIFRTFLSWVTSNIRWRSLLTILSEMVTIDSANLPLVEGSFSNKGRRY